MLKIETKTVRKFIVGGEEFNDAASARKFAIDHEALGALRLLLKASIDSSLVRQGNVDNVLKNILGDAAAVAEILLTYRKRQPKEIKIAA